MLASARRTESSFAANSLSTYLKEIGAVPLLSREEEVALALRARQGDAEALEQLVCANLRFVVSVAKRYQHQGVALSDLINEGNLGLMRAAESFDHEKGVKLISYAVWWIRQSILQALAEYSHTVRVPLSRAGAVYRITRRADALRQELGREPTQQELAVGLGMAEQEVATSLPITRSYISLDAPVADGDDANLLDYLADEAGAAPDDDATDGDLGGLLEKALKDLRGREAEVLRLYFGFDGNDAMTLDAIGERLGITRERVRQIKEKGLSRLRKSRHAAVLTAFCA